MAQRTGLRGLLVVASVLMLAGCLPVDSQVQVPRQSLVEWPGQRLVFVADERTSLVRSYYLGNGSPVAFAQSRSGGHARVRDMQLDEAGGRLWVLGYNGVSVFDARRLTLERFIPVDGAHLSSLRLEGLSVRLIAESGESVGEIDRRGGALGLLAAGVTENVLERAGVVVPGKAVN